MKNTLSLLLPVLLSLSSISSHASVLQTRLATKLSIKTENGKWKKTPWLNVSTLVYRELNGIDPTKCKLELGRGRMLRSLDPLMEDSYPLDLCVRIPSMERIAITTETLKEFALSNAGNAIFGRTRKENLVSEAFQNGIVVREGMDTSTYSQKFIAILNAIFGNTTNIHTLDLENPNRFTVRSVDGGELLRIEIMDRGTMVRDDDIIQFD